MTAPCADKDSPMLGGVFGLWRLWSKSNRTSKPHLQKHAWASIRYAQHSAAALREAGTALVVGHRTAGEHSMIYKIAIWSAQMRHVSMLRADAARPPTNDRYTVVWFGLNIAHSHIG